MRILGHLHTFDDADVIERSLAALLAQSRRLDGIVLVDNASTDATLSRRFPAGVTVIRHDENLGTSGSVVTGMRHGLEHGYEWIWIFDADSAPRPDALARLVALLDGLPPSERERVWLLASLPVDPGGVREQGGLLLDARGSHRIDPTTRDAPYPIDATLWSGSLYRLAAVARLGLPDRDYVLDLGEVEYGYRGARAGLRALAHPQSLFDHNIGGAGSLQVRRQRLGPLRLGWLELPPIRCYYLARNTVFFWLHAYEPRSARVIAGKLARVAAFTANFLLRPWSRWPEARACLRGICDGLRRDLAARF